MDGFAGYKTAAADVVPDAVTVMDRFHVVALSGAKLNLIRQRIQQQTLGRRGHTGDPLYGIRRIARTRVQLLSIRQYHRLSSVLDAEEHIAVKTAYAIYQKITAATPSTEPHRPIDRSSVAAKVANSHSRPTNVGSHRPVRRRCAAMPSSRHAGTASWAP
jgi:transposase